ncbi:MAG TPA: class I SAM-dependent methyltransferase, partial [Bacteroidia bacterium]|nr:class I SAM-dependent methyltransferase [Bacteroidia bacterium]
MTNPIYIHPDTGAPIRETDQGLGTDSGIVFPKEDGVIIVEPDKGYTGNFGFQWNAFQRTQIDKFSGKNQSKDRFFAVTHWDQEVLEGQKILEVGSGAGRFTQVILDHTRADLYSAD